ncbi:MAG: response regulator, partial [Bacteroidales bacterium]|nr:response regulator [Bacteroidales bacterium]
MKNKQTVLIIDDIADNLNVAANTLIPHGINVILAQNGREAIKTATKFLPDLILLDIMMPEMNGFEVCASLKEIDKTKEIPVIFLTAVGETKNIVKGFELGAVDYINKPFISEELISRVKAHLKIHQLNKDLNLKNDEIKNKHNEILSSIRYA